jgi:hypothetical protein
MFSVQFFLFGMQRAALLISRDAGYKWEHSGKLILPSWFSICWPCIIGKWVLLLAMSIIWSWKIALGLVISNYILAAVIPIPYDLYKRIFLKRINQLKLQDPVIGMQLTEMMKKAPLKFKK